jgi:nucleotide-binding universal stress UspA family protein
LRIETKKKRGCQMQMATNTPVPGRGGRHNGSTRGRAAAFVRTGIQTIAVLLDASDAGKTRLHLTAHLAGALKASVTGIGLLPHVTDVSPLLLPSTLPVAELPEVTATAALEQTFRDRMMAVAGVTYDWQVIDRTSVAEMVGHAKRADLTVIGQRKAGSHDGPNFGPEEIVVATGCPTIITPYACPVESIGSRILIAWDGSREVVRAMRDALPLMRDAAQITVLEIDRSTKAGPDYPDAQAAAASLARHGIQAFAENAITAGMRMSDLILNRLADLGADLLIAGLYHHSRTREALFGGVSVELLKTLTVPTLVSH